MQFLDYFNKALGVRKSMPFHEFMQLALYAPEIGYYSTHVCPIGPQGDFTTAPELTPLFGSTIANQCLPILKSVSDPTILEFGAGSGRLCIDILKALDEAQFPRVRYLILEVSATLQAKQKSAILQEIPHWIDRIEWLNEWPKTPLNGVFLANEVLDAMPVHRFLKTEEALLESHIQWNTDTQQWMETFQIATDPQLITYVEEVLQLPQTPYLSECNLWLPDWLNACSQSLAQGVLFILDYGFPRHEYYHSDRNQGTLMCHYQHHAHSNPCHAPSEEDITAHVDFTHVAECAHRAGFNIAGYTNQASFLLANDLLGTFAKTGQNPVYLPAIKQLTHPSEMGELFKVMALSKQFAEPLAGFQLYDKRASL